MKHIGQQTDKIEKSKQLEKIENVGQTIEKCRSNNRTSWETMKHIGQTMEKNKTYEQTGHQTTLNIELPLSDTKQHNKQEQRQHTTRRRKHNMNFPYNNK